jgi:hypothetical protein
MNIFCKAINKVWSQNRKIYELKFLKKVYINVYAYILNVKTFYRKPDNSSRGRKYVANI